ncbi:MAG: anaerobic ribonucleoside-triphosphate reductase activating protein [Lachnospiraceae bacterium]|nr:anaerobic ribonucleoside-triphosphate reductase activating protein [Lachnospiraceae bacterium]
MRIYGLTKTTLLDYPGRTACTVFAGNCNFRCIYCHNFELVTDPPQDSIIKEEEIIAFLEKRKNVLQGICISGGEPTLDPGLKDFIKKVRDTGYPVKLDTNGYRPEVLKELLSEGLIDMVAMDIKTDRERYPVLTGIPGLDIKKLDESVKLIMESGIEYEFRCTVIRGFFDEKASHDVGVWLEGAERLFLQEYEESENVPDRTLQAASKEEMEKYREILSGYIKEVKLRGID